ncbi:MAG: asnB [Enterovirga sp.]|nr:asnB [Enterovirga sp.]
MCGLFASLGHAPDRARIDVVAHRGPDGSGWTTFEAPAGPVALGHRRLAIIDTRDCGLQPMADATGRLHLVFNGEIYNYLELRRELEALGLAFATGTDSEVLIAAYRAWGERCLERFLGMFAFVIYDAAEKRIFAARDRFGIKPLYYAATPAGIAFGSEIKQLLGLPGLPSGMNLARVRDFLAAGLADHSDETMFAGIRQIRAGECMTVEAGRPWRNDATPRRWYAIPPHGTLDIPAEEAAERFRSLLADSVRLHLRSDVPVGSCLSGGLDSSAIVALMSGLLPGTGAAVNTVSACYAEKSVDERPFMEAVVRATGAVPHYVYPRAEDVFGRASDLTWHQDEPFGSTSIFAQHCVFAEARRAGIKVMLDGQGADEQLAGYHGGFPYHLAGLARQARLGAVAATMLDRRAVHGASLGGQIARFAAPFLPGPIQAAGRRLRDGLGPHWLDGDALRTVGPLPNGYDLASALSGLPKATDIATLCVVLTFSANLQMLLHWEDRNSMAHGIEARVPFLDHRLVEFSLALGSRHKMVGAETKHVLRRAVADILPEPVLRRQDKIGFATPEQTWFRGPLKGAMRDGVEATLRRFPDLLHADATRRLTGDMLDGRRPVDFTPWRIVNLGIWGERFGLSL